MGEVLSDVFLWTVASFLVCFGLIIIAITVAVVFSVIKNFKQAKSIIDSAVQTGKKCRDDNIIKTAEEALNGDQDCSPGSGEVRS